MQCGITSFSLNFFSNQIQYSHVFVIIQFPELSNLKQSYFIADETRVSPCIPVLPENFQSARSVFWSALMTLGDIHDLKQHCISYPTESWILCKPLLFRIKQESLIVYSYKFICVCIFHFTLILLKLEHALMTPDSLNQNQTKKVMLLYVGPCQSNGSVTACRMKMPYFF